MTRRRSVGRAFSPGLGISERDIPFLCRKVFRGDYVLRTKGTGLGLSLCEGIMRLNKGKMDIVGVRGGGTTVTVELPWCGEV